MKRPESLLLFVLAVVIGLLILGALHFGRGSSPPDTVTGIYDQPVLVKTFIPLPGAKPAWVCAADGKLYVSYHSRDMVDVFSSDGNRKTGTFAGTLVPGKGTPQGMGVIGDRLLVADYFNKALLFFDKGGKYLESFATRPDGEQFVPVGVAVYNRVFYITDTKINGWMAIGDDGELINAVKGGEEDKTFLEFPYGIVVTEDGRVVITDPKGGKIKVFACPGWYAYDFPAAEVGLRNPQGIAIDGYGRIHVVDNGKSEIFVYDNRGHYLFKYGQNLKGPSGIAIDDNKRVIYVSDTENERIVMWKY